VIDVASRVAALALGAWTAAAGAMGTSVPWDVDRLPESTSEARVLALRPVSPFARFRDALDRVEGEDGEAFRTAAQGVLRWGRNQPGTLLDLGRLAMRRGKARGDALDREAGEALLLEFTRRTTHAHAAGAAAWAEFAPADADPAAVFSGLSPDASAAVASAVAPAFPRGAWALLLPLARDPAGDPRYAALLHDLARTQGRREDAPAIARWARRDDVPPEVRRRLEEAAATLEGPR
jgi:hypothetical protein